MKFLIIFLSVIYITTSIGISNEAISLDKPQMEDSLRLSAKNKYNKPLTIKGIDLSSFGVKLKKSDYGLAFTNSAGNITGDIVIFKTIDECYQRFFHPANYPSSNLTLFNRFKVGYIGDFLYEHHNNKEAFFCRGNILVKVISTSVERNRLAQEIDKEICYLNGIKQVKNDDGSLEKSEKEIPLQIDIKSGNDEAGLTKTSKSKVHFDENSVKQLETSENFKWIWVVLLIIILIPLFIRHYNTKK